MIRQPLAASYAKVHAYSTVQPCAVSFGTNQASLASFKSFSAGVNSERRFMLKELSQLNAGCVFPTNSGVFGFAAGYSGSQFYNESQLGLAYGRTLGKLDVGFQFNYFQLKATGYGSAASVNFEAGIILVVSDQLKAGVHIYNPTRSVIGNNQEERLPLIFSMGFGYDASQKFFIGCVLEKVEDQPVSMNAGMQYSFTGKLFASTGISTGITSFYFGSGFLLNQVRIEATASLHQQLGLTPGLMLTYNVSKK